VQVVVTHQDAPAKKYGQQVKDEQIFASEKVRFIGDEVAAVAAVSEKAAAEALKRIQVTYRQLPAVFDPLQAMEVGAPLVHEQPANVADSSHVLRGDVESVLEKSDYIVELTVVTQAVHPLYLEPFSALAQFQGDKLNLWFPVQNPFIMRNLVADALGLVSSLNSLKFSNFMQHHHLGFQILPYFWT
jgi:CO/xanthine dehydrogenase Mo-binding subunit